MIRPIMKSEIFLAQPSEAATVFDLSLAQDLKDTLQAHFRECAGMAANMIGVRKRAIVFAQGDVMRVMFNPEIVASSGPYDTEEGCLSLDGQRPAKRFRSITVRFDDESFQACTEDFHGWTAQVIQHEIDHCNGIVV